MQLTENIGRRPLTQTPGRFNDISGYSRAMASQGHQPRFLIYEGPLPNPTQVLDFPLDVGVAIWQLGRNLFSVTFSGFVWCKALEFHGHPSAWMWTIMTLKDT